MSPWELGSVQPRPSRLAARGLQSGSLELAGGGVAICGAVLSPDAVSAALGCGQQVRETEFRLLRTPRGRQGGAPFPGLNTTAWRGRAAASAVRAGKRSQFRVWFLFVESFCFLSRPWQAPIMEVLSEKSRVVVTPGALGSGSGDCTGVPVGLRPRAQQRRRPSGQMVPSGRGGLCQGWHSNLHCSITLISRVVKNG